MMLRMLAYLEWIKPKWFSFGSYIGQPPLTASLTAFYTEEDLIKQRYLEYHECVLLCILLQLFVAFVLHFANHLKEYNYHQALVTDQEQQQSSSSHTVRYKRN